MIAITHSCALNFVREPFVFVALKQWLAQQRETEAGLPLTVNFSDDR